jgi:hypothetical protein
MHGSHELHPVLRAGWELAEAVRAELLQTIRPLAPAQWTFRPSPGAWSIGETVDHLRLAEIGSSKMGRKLIRGDYRDQAVPPGAPLFTGELDRYPYGALRAPTRLAPGRIPDQAALLRDLEATHARFRLELGAFAGPDPEALCSADPATGTWYTLGGWVKLQAWHEAHHLAQIRRLMASPDFPR